MHSHNTNMTVAISCLESILVVIDSQLEDYQSLAASVVPGAKILILDPDEDGIKQITHSLHGLPPVSSLHIVSHGSPGCVYLGSTQLSLDDIEGYAEELQGWFTSVAAPQLLIYGCCVAAGDAGEEFVDKLHQITGAGITASRSLTGCAALGGNWELESNTGNLPAEPIFDRQTLQIYGSVMDINGSISIFNLADSSNSYSGIIDSLQGQISDLLINWFSQKDFLTQAAIPFSATAGSNTWTSNALALRESILNRNYSIHLETS